MNRTHEAPERATAPLPAASITTDTTARQAIADLMTRSPHSVGRNQSLETAHSIMRAHGIRHLPVLEGGKLAGVVSQRDLYFVEAIGGVDTSKVTVDEAMSQDAYTVRADAPVEDVALEMADHKYGCAVVMDGAKIVGVFTTTDALRAFANRSRARRAP